MIFVYEDSSGEKTLRKLKSFREDNLYLYGFCEYSGGIRTFRKDRIIETFTDEADALARTSISLATKSTKQRQQLDENRELEICFTGFKAEQRQTLEQLAKDHRLKVRNSVVARLDFLCIGENAGSSKMLKAEEQGVVILTVDQFHDLIQDGVLPENFIDREKSSQWQAITSEQAQTEFKEWVFTVRQALWNALGIQWRYFIDPERTKQARKEWEDNNPRFKELDQLLKPFRRQKNASIKNHPDYPEFERLQKERLSKALHVTSYGISSPRVYNFAEGDIFYGHNCSLQIVSDFDPLEVKFIDQQKNITGYHLTEKNLVYWLRTGEKPDDKYKIDKNQSKSAIAQFYEYST